MGWLQLGRQHQAKPTLGTHLLSKVDDVDSSAPSSQHVEDIPPGEQTTTAGRISGSTSPDKNQQTEKQQFPFASVETPDVELPFISSSEVAARRRPGALSGLESTPATKQGQEFWIVVDNVVYDCSSFIAEHPGGEQVILSFVGEDCSWQFWRFHGKEQMEEFGRKLRVGRTSGVGNRFREPTRWVGLRGFNSADDDWA